MAVRDILKKNRIPLVEGQWSVEQFDDGKDYKFIRNGTEYHVLVNLPEKVREGEAEPNVTIEIVSNEPKGRFFVTYFKNERDGEVFFELKRQEQDDEKFEVTATGEARLEELRKNGDLELNVIIGGHKYSLPETLGEKDVQDFTNAVETDPNYDGFILVEKEADKI